MKAKIITASIALFLMAFATTSFAQTQTPATPAPATPVVKARQENQQKRIGEGVENGSLTAKETEHLEKREAKIQADKKADKADGTVTPAEKKQLRKEQNNTSKAIYRQKHDAQKRH